MKKTWLAVTLAVAAGVSGRSLLAEAARTPQWPEVPYPEGYRNWRHITSAVLPPKETAPTVQSEKTAKVAAPHGLMVNLYANEGALEGYRTKHFPEGAVLIADWFVLEKKGPELVQGSRKSINVMIRDARYATTGGWGFEDFDQDSHTVRNVGGDAQKTCFECHRRASEREYVFSVLKP